jgi:hypothetical protein
MMTKDEAARKIEEHIQILVDYDVLEAQVADTLTEYIWSIINEIDPVVDVDVLKQIWDEKDRTNEEPME